jgi:hypothetical protein
MTKLIQICASQDDLFALDDDGEVYQYDFRQKTWVKLVADRTQDTRAAGQSDGAGTSRRAFER